MTERCANTEALNRYENEQDKQEKRYEQALKEFNDIMQEYIDNMIVAFTNEARVNLINRNELRDLLLESIGEQL